MKHYIRIMLNIIFVVFSLGFVGPYLMSAPSDFAVIGGLVYLLLIMPAVIYYTNRNYMKKVMEKIDE